MPWVWNESTGQYRDTPTGRFISFGDITNLMNLSIDNVIRETEDLARAVARGDITVNRWFDSMRQKIKQTYIWQVELGAGGRGRVTPELWDEVIGRIWQQYQYLNGFAEDLAEGKLTEGQIVRRSQMYINSSRSAFWLARDAAAKKKGMTQERWIAIGDQNTCSPCFDADAMGWQSIGTFAEPGSGVVLVGGSFCEGLTSCRCIKEYR